MSWDPIYSLIILIINACISEQRYLGHRVATNMKHVYKQYNKKKNYKTTLDKKEIEY
jgi:hypothetical protein